MYSLKQIEQESRRAANRAAREGLRPVAVYPEDLQEEESFEGFCRTLPFLGNYKHPGKWSEVEVDTVHEGYPYKWYFVDASGFGQSGEPALTHREFRRKLLELCNRDGHKYALGIAEAGQFQVHIALYEGG